MPKSGNLRSVACSLTDQQSKERRSLIRKTLLPHINHSSREAGGVRVGFPNTTVIRSNLEEFVRLERQCCEFLTFRVRSSEDQLMLSIDGPEEAGKTLEMFAEGLSSRRILS